MSEETICPKNVLGIMTLCKEGIPFRIPSNLENNPNSSELPYWPFSPYRCRAWVPERTTAKMCTLPFDQRSECPIEQGVESPIDGFLFCAGCDYFKKFNIEPVPAYCILCRR